MGLYEKMLSQSILGAAYPSLKMSSIFFSAKQKCQLTSSSNYIKLVYSQIQHSNILFLSPEVSKLKHCCQRKKCDQDKKYSEWNSRYFWTYFRYKGDFPAMSDRNIKTLQINEKVNDKCLYIVNFKYK